MKLTFGVLMMNYPRKREVERDVLFREIGWDDLIPNPSYQDTCAIRVSLALIRSGITIPGRIAIKTGPHKGKMIEPGQAKLSAILSRPSMLGKPQKFPGQTAILETSGRSGIVSFFRLIPGRYEGGHIDIVSPRLGGATACGSSCHWTSAETWFWALE